MEVRNSAGRFDKGNRTGGGKTGERHWNWRGGKAAFQTAHRAVVKEWGSASLHQCSDCDKQAYDWSYIDPIGHGIPSDYVPRCRSCHQKYDTALLHAGWQAARTAGLV